MEEIGEAWNKCSMTQVFSADEIVARFLNSTPKYPKFENLKGENAVQRVTRSISFTSQKVEPGQAGDIEKLSPEEAEAKRQKALAEVRDLWNSYLNHTIRCLYVHAGSIDPNNPAVIEFLASPIGNFNPLTRCVLSNMHPSVVYAFGFEALRHLASEPILSDYLMSKGVNLTILQTAPNHD